MAGEARRIVLFARYTSLVGPASGTQDFYGAPVNVREFASGNVVGWGTGGTFTLQESVDMATWTDKGTVTMGTGQSVTPFDPLDTEWVRAKATLANGDRLSCWVVGDFAVRGT